MKQCKRIEKKLSAYQDGELGFEERAKMKAHLQDCEACRRKSVDIEQVWEGLGQLSEIRPDAGFYVKLERKIELESEHIFLRKLRNVFYLLPNPAAAFALLLAGILLGIYAGNTLTGEGLWPMPRRESIYTGGVTLASLSAFDPLPPGTLATGYIQMANYREEAHR